MRSTPLFGILLLLLLMGSLLAMAPALRGQELDVRISQIDTSQFPRITVYVTVTGPGGQPLTDAESTRLIVVERGEEVSSRVLAEGIPVSSVLVVDLSGSMDLPKLEAAKAAAISYLDLAPREHEIALVSFRNVARVEVGFETDRELLRRHVGSFEAAGQTALQDGIGQALDLLRDRSGRKSVLLLTDGIENHSTRYPKSQGLARLLERSAQEEVSVSTIGFATDRSNRKQINEAYLAKFEATGGHYRFAPNETELTSAFVMEAKRLESEQVLEFESRHMEPDGARERIDVKLAVGQRQAEATTMVVVPGLVPHVRADHSPYFWAIGILFALSSFVPLLQKLLATYHLRTACLRRLTHSSPFVGRREINSSHELEAGDRVLLCPACETPHFPRSWRFNRCRCMVEHDGRGRLCYSRLLPTWLRHALDSVTGGAIDADGRRWLCRCAGDKEGY